MHAIFIDKPQHSDSSGRKSAKQASSKACGNQQRPRSFAATRANLLHRSFQFEYLRYRWKLINLLKSTLAFWRQKTVYVADVQRENKYLFREIKPYVSHRNNRTDWASVYSLIWLVIVNIVSIN